MSSRNSSIIKSSDLLKWLSLPDSLYIYLIEIFSFKIDRVMN